MTTTKAHECAYYKEAGDHDWKYMIGLDVPCENGMFYTGNFLECAVCGTRGCYMDDSDKPGEKIWLPMTKKGKKASSKKRSSMRPSIPPQLTCDDGFDMFSTPLHTLEDEIAQTDDPYTLGYLRGVLDFRQQMSMILGTEKA